MSPSSQAFESGRQNVRTSAHADTIGSFESQSLPLLGKKGVDGLANCMIPIYLG